MQTKIIVEILFDENIPDENQQYTASVNNDDYKIVVTGKNIPECFEQIAISMECTDNYKAKENEKA